MRHLGTFWKLGKRKPGDARWLATDASAPCRSTYVSNEKRVVYPVIWVFPKIEVPQNGWFIMENSIKWMIWGYHYFRKHSSREYNDYNKPI